MAGLSTARILFSTETKPRRLVKNTLHRSHEVLDSDDSEGSDYDEAPTPTPRRDDKPHRDGSGSSEESEDDQPATPKAMDISKQKTFISIDHDKDLEEHGPVRVLEASSRQNSYGIPVPIEDDPNFPSGGAHVVQMPEQPPTMIQITKAETTVARDTAVDPREAHMSSTLSLTLESDVWLYESFCYKMAEHGYDSADLSQHVSRLRVIYNLLTHNIRVSFGLSPSVVPSANIRDANFSSKNMVIVDFTLFPGTRGCEDRSDYWFDLWEMLVQTKAAGNKQRRLEHDASCYNSSFGPGPEQIFHEDDSEHCRGCQTGPEVGLECNVSALRVSFAPEIPEADKEITPGKLLVAFDLNSQESVDEEDILHEDAGGVIQWKEVVEKGDRYDLKTEKIPCPPDWTAPYQKGLYYTLNPEDWMTETTPEEAIDRQNQLYARYGGALEFFEEEE